MWKESREVALKGSALALAIGSGTFANVKAAKDRAVATLDYGMRRWSVLAISVALLCAGCAAARPVFYPNEQLTRAGNVGADRDIEECMRLADAYVSGSPAREVARDTALGAGTGAAIGAVGGAVYGGAGRGAAAGAATGATAGLLAGLFRGHQPSAIYQNYVNACLADRGYRVLGWQ